MSIFFILGAGASVDSGLPTYRGPEGLYGSSKADYDKVVKFLSTETPVNQIWEFFEPLLKQIGQSDDLFNYNQSENRPPGKTYELIKDIGTICEGSFILTQNIDGYALTTGIPTVEMHGDARTMYCFDKRCDMYNKLILIEEGYKCIKCYETCRPNIVLFGEPLDNIKTMNVFTFIKKSPKYVVIIGTSLQFPYLETFISKAKQRGAQVIHINPDVEYHNNIGKHEEWLKVPAAKGLQVLLDRFKKELAEPVVVDLSELFGDYT